MKTRLTGAAFGLALVAAVFVLVWIGPSALIAAMFPVLTALAAWLLRKQAARIIATILIGGFALIGSFTIGLFYVPAAILMLLASCVDDSAKLRDVFP